MQDVHRIDRKQGGGASEQDHMGDGSWFKSTIFDFNGDTDRHPEALVASRAGGLFGNSEQSGAVFRLIPPTMGTAPWDETVIFNANPDMTNTYPVSALTLDSNQALYLVDTGVSAYGSICRLVGLEGSGSFLSQTLYTFPTSELRAAPSASLIVGPGANLFGMALADHQQIVIFQLARPPIQGEMWSLNILFKLSSSGSSGLPVGALTYGAGGLLYGVVSAGGEGPRVCASSACGFVFAVKP
jgi:hypothetical protein